MNSLLARIMFFCGIIVILFSLIYGVMAIISGYPLILFVGTFIGLCIISLAEIVDKVTEMDKKLEMLIKQSKNDEI